MKCEVISQTGRRKKESESLVFGVRRSDVPMD